MFTPLERLNANGHNNNFNLLRVVAALSVVVSHAFPIALGEDAAASPDSFSMPGFNLGRLALWTFFIISGFFVSQSFEKHKPFEFIVARILRIYPGLLMALVFSALIAGPLCSKLMLGDYIASASPYVYIVHNLLLGRAVDKLPGNVFAGNPYPFAMNEPLWTLFYEVICYGMVMAAGFISCRRVSWFAVFLGLYLAGYFYLEWLDGTQGFLANNQWMQDLHELTLPFVAGMAYYQFRRMVPYSPFLAGFAFLMLIFGPPHDALIVLWSYIVIYIGFYPSQWLQNYNKIGDYSYGIYIYGWPVAQTLEYFYKTGSPYELMGLTIPVTLLIAMASWDLIEKPAMDMRARILEYMQGRRLSPTAA